MPSGRIERLAVERILADGNRWHVRDVTARFEELIAAPPAWLEGLEMPVDGTQSSFIALLNKIPGLKSDGSRLWWL